MGQQDDSCEVMVFTEQYKLRGRVKRDLRHVLAHEHALPETLILHKVTITPVFGETPHPIHVPQFVLRTRAVVGMAMLQEAPQGGDAVWEDPKVEAIMTRNPLCVSPETTVEKAFELIWKHKIRHILVARGLKLKGVVSDRDLRLYSHAPEIRLEEIMSKDLLTLTPEDKLSRAIQLVVTEKVGCLPILRDGDLVGLVTQIDLLRYFDEIIM